MTTKHVNTSKTWHVALWIAQILVGGMFIAVGAMKTFTPIAELGKMMPLASEMPVLLRFIGISELAGGLGLLLPALLRIRPKLTVAAGLALAVVMVLAIGYHLLRAEFSAVGTPAVLGILAGLIAWGRIYKAPITARFSAQNSIAKT